MVSSIDQLVPTIETVIAAVRAGELDDLLAQQPNLDELLAQQAKAKDVPKHKLVARTVDSRKHIWGSELTGSQSRQILGL